MNMINKFLIICALSFSPVLFSGEFQEEGSWDSGLDGDLDIENFNAHQNPGLLINFPQQDLQEVQEVLTGLPVVWGACLKLNGLKPNCARCTIFQENMKTGLLILYLQNKYDEKTVEKIFEKYEVQPLSSVQKSSMQNLGGTHTTLTLSDLQRLHNNKTESMESLDQLDWGSNPSTPHGSNIKEPITQSIKRTPSDLKQLVQEMNAQ